MMSAWFQQWKRNMFLKGVLNTNVHGIVSPTKKHPQTIFVLDIGHFQCLRHLWNRTFSIFLILLLMIIEYWYEYLLQNYKMPRRILRQLYNFGIQKSHYHQEVNLKIMYGNDVSNVRDYTTTYGYFLWLLVKYPDSFQFMFFNCNSGCYEVRHKLPSSIACQKAFLFNLTTYQVILKCMDGMVIL